MENLKCKKGQPNRIYSKLVPIPHYSSCGFSHTNKHFDTLWRACQQALLLHMYAVFVLVVSTMSIHVRSTEPHEGYKLANI